MTESPPWTADVEMDEERAARAVAEALPDLAPVEARRLGWGWDFYAFEVNRRWVFRFPRRAKEQERLARELVLLPWIASHLDAPVPRYGWGTLHAASFPYTFSGYEKLHGIQAADVDPESIDRDRLGRWLGDFFRRLHALRPREPLRREAGFRPPDWPVRRIHAHMRKYLPAFRAHAPDLADRAARFFDDPTDLPPEHEVAPVLIHNDLHAEHLLVDAADPQRVTGLLDWGDVDLGDPAADFAAIYPWGGEPLLTAMRAGYGDLSDDVIARARVHGTCLAFQDFDYWMTIDREDWGAHVLRTLDAVLPP
ncbi:MAG: phosphotransferase family protein [Planctomycetota bacterium]